MRRILATAVVAAAAGFALVARPVAAQSIPNITAAKTAATNAAKATNAHTAAVTGAAAEKPGTPVAQPAKAQPAKAQPSQAQPASAKPASAKPATTKPDARPAATPAATKPDPKAARPEPKATKPEAKATKPAVGPDAKPARAADQSRTAAPVARDSAQTIKVGATTNVAKRGAASELTFAREVYTYPGRGRRDPFMSLLKSGDLRPMLSDLRLVTVLYDPTGRNSVAIMRDLSTRDQYRVKVGQQLGRMRVAQIQPRQLVLTIEEFGFNRQETLALTSDSTRTR